MITFYVKFLLTIAKLLRAIGNIANKTCDRILTYLENLLDEIETQDITDELYEQYFDDE